MNDQHANPQTEESKLPCSCGWASSDQLKVRVALREDPSGLTAHGHRRFPAFGLGLKRWLFLGHKPAGLWTGPPALAPLGPQLADYGPWDLPASVATWASPDNKPPYGRVDTCALP